MNDVGVVIIGRNEGARLRRCLAATDKLNLAQVYVDSGSTDESVAEARSMGAKVVELDTTIPFTAARARNSGAEVLLHHHPDIAFIQFLDGDCEPFDGWLPAAQRYLEDHPTVGVVCGRRRERFPDATIYNRLCDMEWNTPVGSAQEFGGDALMRVEAYRAVGGYRSSMIAGEEPEMAVRLRAAGWQVMRLGEDMTWHDAAMTRWGQWWKRCVRSGHALAEMAWIHGRSEGQPGVRAWRSTLGWTGGMLVLMVGLWLVVGKWALLAGLIYGLLFWRIFRWRVRRGDRVPEGCLYALFCVLGKWPQAWGVLRFHVNVLRGRQACLIEYKGVSAIPSGDGPKKVTGSGNPPAQQIGNS